MPEGSVGYQPQTVPVDRLPRCGCPGLITPGEMTAFASQERRLSEFPKLNIPQGEAWERNMILNTWVNEIVLAATAVSMNFSDFVTKIMESAREHIRLPEG